MGELRDKFWTLPLEALSRAEWEALCDGCGRCCLHKIEDADTGDISDTNVACKLLDTQTAQCTDYRNRKAFVPDCLRLTLKIVKDVKNQVELSWTGRSSRMSPGCQTRARTACARTAILFPNGTI